MVVLERIKDESDDPISIDSYDGIEWMFGEERRGYLMKGKEER